MHLLDGDGDALISGQMGEEHDDVDSVSRIDVTPAPRNPDTSGMVVRFLSVAETVGRRAFEASLSAVRGGRPVRGVRTF
jgi:hypothetical protein